MEAESEDARSTAGGGEDEDMEDPDAERDRSGGKEDRAVPVLEEIETSGATASSSKR